MQLSLEQDLQQQKKTIAEFVALTTRVLQYLPNVVSGSYDKTGYRVYHSQRANTKTFVRPISIRLFIEDAREFINKYSELEIVIAKIRNRETEYSDAEKLTIDSVLYTIQQSIGAGIDLLLSPNSGRKHVGNRFEELMKCFFSEIGIPNKRVVFKIPYDTDDTRKNTYTCENDLILSPHPSVNTNNSVAEVILEAEEIHPMLDGDIELSLNEGVENIVHKYITPREVIVSVKTTSKDRMGKMFMDKILLQRFVGHDLKVIGIFLNDVQRKDDNNISFTLVSGLFMVYNQFITEMNGVYYLDPPPNAEREPYNRYIKRFSDLITSDINMLLSA